MSRTETTQLGLQENHTCRSTVTIRRRNITRHYQRTIFIALGYYTAGLVCTTGIQTYHYALDTHLHLGHTDAYTRTLDCNSRTAQLPLETTTTHNTLCTPPLGEAPSSTVCDWTEMGHHLTKTERFLRATCDEHAREEHLALQMQNTHGPTHARLVRQNRTTRTLETTNAHADIPTPPDQRARHASTTRHNATQPRTSAEQHHRY